MVKSASKNDPLNPGQNDPLLEKEGPMTSIETIAKVRSDHHKNIPIKEIARKRGISRNTVRSIIREQRIDSKYQRKLQPLPQLGPYVERLEQMLEEHLLLPKKQQPPLTRLFEALQLEGYTGGYDSVRRYSKSWISQNAKAEDESSNGFIPLTFRPGEAYQFDWSTETIMLGGLPHKVKVAHFTLCHSRMRFSRIYRREKLEMVMDAHVRAFEFWGGHCERGVYDNMSTAVTKILIGKNRLWNQRFLTMLSHYGLDPDACNPASGWEKGRVERGVQTSRSDFFKPFPKTNDIEELNRLLLEDCVTRARRREHPERKNKTIWEVFLEEKKALISAQTPFDPCVDDSRCSSKDGLVNVDRNRYSVHCNAANKSVDIRLYAERIVIYHGGKIVGEHSRRFGRDFTVFDPVHYLPLLEKRPGSLRNAAPFCKDTLPPPLRKVWEKMERRTGGDREFVKVLCAANEFGWKPLIQACQVAIHEGTVSQEVIVNILNRGRNPTETVENVDLPPHLVLEEDPDDNCIIYDTYLMVQPCPEN